MNKNEFLKALTVKSDTIALETLNGETVTVRELTIAESNKIRDLREKVSRGEASSNELIIETCRYAMIEPEFLSDDEISNLSHSGFSVLTEIYMRLPEIGMTEAQKAEYKERLTQGLSEELKKLSGEELEKKQSKKKGSSSN